MTSSLDSFVMVTFRVAADTPPADATLNGQTFYFPPEYLPEIGSGPGSPGVIVATVLVGGVPTRREVKGYMQVTAGPTYEWLMTSGLSSTAIAQLDAITTWVDPAARAVYLDWARTMRRDWGAPPAGIRDALTALYNAAAANRDAQHAGGG